MFKITESIEIKRSQRSVKREEEEDKKGKKRRDRAKARERWKKVQPIFSRDSLFSNSRLHEHSLSCRVVELMLDEADTVSRLIFLLSWSFIIYSFRSFNSSLSSFLLRFIQFFSLLGNNGTTTNSWNLVHTNSDRSVFHFVQPIRLDKILSSSTISLHLMLSLLSMPERDVPFFSQLNRLFR